MPDQQTIPSDRPGNIVFVDIYTNGNPLPSTIAVLSINVVKDINRIASARLVIQDGDLAAAGFAASNLAIFEPGNEIEIKAGYDRMAETIFKGIVIKHGIRVAGQMQELYVECRDVATRMTVVPKNNYYHDLADSDIMTQIIAGYGMETKIMTTSYKHQQQVQYNCTDWDFVVCRADANGMLCFTDDNIMVIAKPDFSTSPVLKLTYGIDIIDLDAEIDARCQLNRVTASGWDYTNQEMSASMIAALANLPTAGNLSRERLAAVIGAEQFAMVNGASMSEAELQEWADAKMMKHQLAKIRGSVSCYGSARAKPGSLIELAGTSERFDGLHYITGVTHEIGDGNWKTEFRFGMKPEWFAETNNVQQPLAAALLPGVPGLQTGIVTKLEGDPEGGERILVTVPSIHSSDQGAWCRISTLDAGNDRGSFFMPEIGDEVVIGFINNDPRQGMVLGMCNSNRNPAPFPATDENHQKGFKTRSGIKMIFDDDKKAFSIETPGGNRITVSDEEKQILIVDQNGNSMEMNHDGITISSTKDLVLKATGAVLVKGTNVDLQALGGINLDASSLHLKAKNEASLEGATSASLKSGGTTIIRGGIVTIN